LSKASDIETSTLVTFLLTAVLFSLAGFINAVFAQSFDDISIVPTFILMPMVYLGGIITRMLSGNEGKIKS
jgi:hypothetical protein